VQTLLVFLLSVILGLLIACSDGGVRSSAHLSSDTITTWHIYRNGKVIFDNVWAKSPVIRLADLKREETVSIGVYHCSKSTTPVKRSAELWTEDRKLWRQYEIETAEEDPVTIPASDLLLFWREQPKSKLFVYFKERQHTLFDTTQPLVVFAL
jgi:hypothetical protein